MVLSCGGSALTDNKNNNVVKWLIEELKYNVNTTLQEFSLCIINEKDILNYIGEKKKLIVIPYWALGRSLIFIQKLGAQNVKTVSYEKELNKNINKFLTFFNSNHGEYIRMVGWSLNDLSTNYMHDTEMYIQELEENKPDFSSYASELDDFFSLRDKIEFIKLGIYKLNHQNYMSYLKRYEKKILTTDELLKEFFIKIIKYYKLEEHQYDEDNIYPKDFWWRKSPLARKY